WTTLSCCNLLGVGPQVQQLNVVQASAAQSDGELALLTRSIAEVMQEFATCVDVPQSDVTEGRVLPSSAVNRQRLFRVRRSEGRPSDAFTAVEYRGSWYYVDDRDLESKRSFNVALLVQCLQETSGGAPAPLVTVSTN